MLVAVTMAALAAAAGCGSGEPSFEDPPDFDLVAQGEEVFRSLCSECHSLNPPPKLAPPMSLIAAAVRQATEDRRAFTDHVVGYVQAPSEDRSLMPAEAIRNFGLMPAQTVGRERLLSAAAYMWTLADTSAARQ